MFGKVITKSFALSQYNIDIGYEKIMLVPGVTENEVENRQKVTDILNAISEQFHTKKKYDIAEKNYEQLKTPNLNTHATTGFFLVNI
jgi:hypothetical protein